MKLKLGRTSFLMSALGLTIAASLWTLWSNVGPTVAIALPRHQSNLPPRNIAAVPSVPGAAVRTGGVPKAESAVADLFAVVDWTERPDSAEPPSPPPPAPPQVPPLPFEFIGRTQVASEPGNVVVHLRRGKEVLSVSEGESIDEQYTLQKIGDDALEFNYLPMSARQILSTGSR